VAAGTDPELAVAHSIAAGGSGTSAPWWLILPEQFVLLAFAGGLITAAVCDHRIAELPKWMTSEHAQHAHRRYWQQLKGPPADW
jgi:hypothetical protein